jgi:hypothetical protein
LKTNLFLHIVNFKGLTTYPIAINDSIVAALQSGLVDIGVSDAVYTLERGESFLFTTPISIERYGALMKRQKGAFAIDVDSLTAGVDLDIHEMLFGILLFLLFVAWTNERLQHSNERNSIWNLLRSLFPSNGQMWPRQTGVTRKILMVTCGFGTLILSSLYCAKQSEQLMLPYPPPIVTLRDIELAVTQGDARLIITNRNSIILNFIANMSSTLKDSLITHPPMYDADHPAISQFDAIDIYNGILLGSESRILQYLSQSDPSKCGNYIYVGIDEWTRLYSGFMMRNERVDVLESMNVIVAERMAFVDDYIQTSQLDDECRKGLFSDSTPDSTYAPLQLVEISGALVFLFAFLCFSVVVLLIEVAHGRWKKKDNLKQQNEEETFSIYIRFNNEIELDGMINAETFAKIRALIEM